MTSSMKYIDLEGLTPLQIIQKYEELLLQRESMIQLLKTQLNDSQQKYNEISETIEKLSKRNKELNEEKLKCDKTLNQQRIDKDLLFIKLNNLISENDKLTNVIQGKKDSKPPVPSSSGTHQKKDKNKDANKKTNNTNNIINNNNLRLELKKEEKDPNKKEDTNVDNNIVNKNEEKRQKEENKKDEKEIEKNEIKEQNNKNDDKNNININDVIKEKNEEKDQNKKEDKKEENIPEDKKEDNKIDDNKNEEIKSKSEKKIITVNPEEYLAKRKKKHKGGRKLMSEKISYDPVFK